VLVFLQGEVNIEMVEINANDLKAYLENTWRNITVICSLKFEEEKTVV
jgi:hypothetical protein